MRLKISRKVKIVTIFMLITFAGSSKGLAQSQDAKLKHGNGDIISLWFTDGGSHLLSASWDGTIVKWNLTTGGRSGFLDLDEKKSEHKETISHVRQMAVSSAGDLISISYSQTSVVNKVLQSDKVNRIALIDPVNLRVKTILSNDDSEFVFSPDGKTLVTVGPEKMARIWSTNDGKEIKRFSVKKIGKPLFGSEGKLVVAAAVGWDNAGPMIAVYDLISGKIVQEIPERLGQITGIAVSANGRSLAVGGYNGGIRSLRIWDLSQRTPKNNPLNLLLPESQLTYNMVFSADGGLLASSGVSTCCEMVAVWAMSGNQTRKNIKALGDVKSLAFSPDGKHIAYGTSKGEIVVLKL